MIGLMRRLRESGFELRGNVRVDSGQLMIADPCYVVPSYGEQFTKRYDHILEYYVGIEEDGMIEPWDANEALVFSMFGGDGLFRVFVRKDEGQVTQILIDFEGED